MMAAHTREPEPEETDWPVEATARITQLELLALSMADERDQAMVDYSHAQQQIATLKIKIEVLEGLLKAAQQGASFGNSNDAAEPGAATAAAVLASDARAQRQAEQRSKWKPKQLHPVQLQELAQLKAKRDSLSGPSNKKARQKLSKRIREVEDNPRKICAETGAVVAASLSAPSGASPVDEGHALSFSHFSAEQYGTNEHGALLRAIDAPRNRAALCGAVVMNATACHNIYVEFDLVKLHDDAMIGIGRPWLNVERRNCYTEPDCWGLATFSGRLRHAGRHTSWDGVQPFAHGDVVGLHLESGNLVAFKNGERLGVAATGLDGDFCWLVALEHKDDAVRIRLCKNPIST